MFKKTSHCYLTLQSTHQMLLLDKVVSLHCAVSSSFLVSLVSNSFSVFSKYENCDLAQTVCASLSEQVGQEILSNLHTDREKIQRARERVSKHSAPVNPSACASKCL